MRREILLNGGSLLPKRFVLSYNMRDWGVDDFDKEVLLNGPDDYMYWDSWRYVLRTARFTDTNGVVWGLEHSDNLYMVSCE